MHVLLSQIFVNSLSLPVTHIVKNKYSRTAGGPGRGTSRGRRDNGERLDIIRPDRQSR